MSSAMKISESMLDGLINQANEELNASNLYLSMSLWFHDLELHGSAQWCRTHSDEERTHALKIFDHIVKRRAKGGMVRNLEEQKFNFDTPVQAW
jgi:ferritin